ncbi:hypothetical protein, partial [Bradyrhizobium sp. HKCCYLRH1062]|uniref:hypothetical protein n=1 Tax=unclassified Bradyrhizobium TaxID=2631580 RepID=UPI003EB727A4
PPSFRGAREREPGIHSHDSQLVEQYAETARRHHNRSWLWIPGSFACRECPGMTAETMAGCCRAALAG